MRVTKTEQLSLCFLKFIVMSLFWGVALPVKCQKVTMVTRRLSTEKHLACKTNPESYHKIQNRLSPDPNSNPTIIHQQQSTVQR